MNVNRLIVRGVFAAIMGVLLFIAIDPAGFWKKCALGLAAGMSSWWIKVEK